MNQINYLKKPFYFLDLILVDVKNVFQLYLNPEFDYIKKSSLTIFLRLHLPLLILSIIACLFAPSNFLNFKFDSLLSLKKAQSFSLTQTLLPIFLILIFIFYTILFDNFLEFQKPKLDTIYNKENPYPNLSLLISLPIAGVGVFFFFHKLLGYAMFLICIIRCVYFSLEYSAANYNLTRARVLTFWITTGIFILFNILILSLLINIYDTIKIALSL